MDKIEKKSIWRDKSSDGIRLVQVLDVGVWYLDPETKIKRTMKIDEFLDRYEYVGEKNG